MVRALIAAGADVNAKNFRGATALMIASKNNKVDEVQALIAAGAELNYQAYTDIQHATLVTYFREPKNGEGRTALMVSSAEGHLQIVQALVDAGADVNAKDSDGYTALMYATSYGHAEIVRLLKKAGAK